MSKTAKQATVRAPSLSVELRRKMRVEMVETRQREVAVDEVAVVEMMTALGVIPAGATDVKVDNHAPKSELIGRVSWAEKS
jgi:hypothetical protein